jgi:lysophospholipase L1-like esterase
MKSGRESIYASVLILVSVAVALASGELVLRAITPDTYYVFPPGLERTFRPVPGTMPGISGDSRFLINEEPFYKRTEVWRRLRVAKHALLGSSENVLVQDEAGDIYIGARRRRHEAPKEDRLFDLSRGLAAYARNLERIIDAAQSRQARVVFMTQPSIWRSDLPAELDAQLFMGGPIGGDFYDTAQKREAYYSVEVLADAMQQYNDELLRVCDARAVLCLDLASQIPKDTSSLYDDVHFNEAGATKVARALADFLKKSHIF